MLARHSFWKLYTPRAAELGGYWVPVVGSSLCVGLSLAASNSGVGSGDAGRLLYSVSLGGALADEG